MKKLMEVSFSLAALACLSLMAYFSIKYLSITFPLFGELIHL